MNVMPPRGYHDEQSHWYRRIVFNVHECSAIRVSDNGHIRDWFAAYTPDIPRATCERIILVLNVAHEHGREILNILIEQDFLAGGWRLVITMAYRRRSKLMPIMFVRGYERSSGLIDRDGVVYPDDHDTTSQSPAYQLISHHQTDAIESFLSHH